MAMGPDQESFDKMNHPGFMQMVNMFGSGPTSPSVAAGPDLDRQELLPDEVVYGGDAGSAESRFRTRKNMRVSRTSLKFRKLLN